MNIPGSDCRILVTGASGFVGSALCTKLRASSHAVRRMLRAAAQDGTEDVAIGDITTADCGQALRGITHIVHLAARTHVLNESANDALAAYRRVNVEATTALARAAALSGVKRFVFMSSVKVTGERTDHPFTETDPPHPEDAYGISKLEAEQALRHISEQTGMEAVVLRAPLVYGPDVKGNFLRLMALVVRGYPLPLASVRNRRSLIHVGSLVDAIITCIEHPAAAGKTYLVSDGEDISTPDLICALAAALDVPAKLFPCPVALLRLGAAVLGKSGEISKLTESLQVDSARIRRELGWQPRFSLAQGLEKTAQWYLKAVNR